MASKIERIQVRLPAGFDPAKHQAALLKKVTETKGSGFEIDSIDPQAMIAVFTRQVAITEVTQSTKKAETFDVRLARGTKVADGEKQAARLEDTYAEERNERGGYYMTKFEPFLGYATLSRLTDDEARCRGAIAVSLGVKPWEVQVKARPDGGFDLELPKTYQPSKAAKIQEVADSVVGREGWYATIDAQKLTASLIPSEPPTFPEGISFPIKRLGKGDLDRVPFGRVLPEPGAEEGPEITLDWTASAWALVAGTPGPQPLDARIPVPVSEKFPTGWARFGDLAVGDEVFTRHGGTTRVIELHPIREQSVHTLHLSDGQTVKCGDNHLWLVSDDYSRKAHGRVARGRAQRAILPLEKVVQTKDLVANLRRTDGGRNWGIRVSEAIDHTEADLPLDPYFFGAWLGDGTTRTGGITVGADDLDDMRAELELFRPVTRIEVKTGTEAVTLHFGRLDEERCLRGHKDWRTTDLNARYCRSCRVSDSQHDAPINQSVHTILSNMGVLNNKHIPANFLRASAKQRLAVLQGLMDTDGTIDVKGACELTLVDRRLAADALELIRSLGIKASMSESDAAITDPSGARRVVGTRQRIHFTTSQPVFRMRRKAERLPTMTRETQKWLYIEDITIGEPTEMRCITVEDEEHLYLTDGFVPTHNSGKSVTLNAIIADALSNGSELAIVDDVSKAIDFEWARTFCRPGGWGCDSLEAGVATLGLVREEGAKRAKVLKGMGINNWLDMPKGQRFTPILVIVDEVSALVVPDPVPKGVPKDHPLYLEIAERNLARAMLQSFMRKIIAELRFVGVRMVLSTQATNANTGVDPGMRTLIGHKILQGVNPSKAARTQIFADESAVPGVPENVKAGGKRAKGVGVAHLESQAPLIYKSYFASIDDYGKALKALGVKTNAHPEPTSAQMDRFLPKLEDGKEDARDSRPAVRGGERAPSGRLASEVAREMGDEYGVALQTGGLGTGFEKANAARHAAANPGKPTGKQKRESAEEAGWAAQSGAVTTKTRTPDQNNPFHQGATSADDDW